MQLTNTGKVGVNACGGVPVTVRLPVGDIDASDDAVPYLLVGEGFYFSHTLGQLRVKD